MVSIKVGQKQTSNKVFVREATGLVKQVSLFSTFAYNVNAQTVGFLVTSYGVILAFLPGADATVAFLITMAFAIPFILVYVFFTAVMPRSGGDYVFVSRSLSPAFGFVESACFWIVEIVFLGISAGWIGSVYMSSAFSLVGNLLNSRLLTNIGTLVATPNINFVIGTIVLVGIGLTLIFGTKVHFAFQNILFIVGVVAALVMIAVLAASTSSQFQASFNAHAASYTNSSDPYNYVISLAKDKGFTTAPVSLYMTMAGGTSALSSVAFGYFSTYGAGEMKRANSIRRQATAMIGSMLFNATLGLVIVVLLLRVAGTEFVSASYYLAYVSPSSFPYPVAPFLNLFVGMLTSNLALNIIMALGWIVWGIAISAILFVMLTRVLFAWSYDRLIPSFFAKVDDKFHGPLIATVTIIVLGEILLYVFGLAAPGTALFLVTFVLTALTSLTVFLVTPISAIIFPIRKKEIYDKSIARNYRIGKIPIMSIVGAISTSYILLLIYYYLTISSIGVNSPPVLETIASIILACVAVYGVIKFVRRSQGVPLDLAFKEIPPE
jgi:APA family basic amino acid/polyamine antiporter